MSRNIELKKAERKLFSMVFDDGLLDIMIAAFLLMFAIAPILSETMGDFWSSAVFLPFWGVLYLILHQIRKHLVSPRLGLVKFSQERKLKLTRFTIFMLIINVLFLIGGIIVAFESTDRSPHSMGWMAAVGLGLGLLFFASLASFSLNLPRLFIYGILLAIAPIIGEWLYRDHGASHHGYPIVFGAASAIIFIVGLVMFIRLMCAPYPPEDPAVVREA